MNNQAFTTFLLFYQKKLAVSVKNTVEIAAKAETI